MCFSMKYVYRVLHISSSLHHRLSFSFVHVYFVYWNKASIRNMVTKINRMKNTLALHNREGKKARIRKARKVYFRLLWRDFCDFCLPVSSPKKFLYEPSFRNRQRGGKGKTLEPKDNEMKQIMLVNLRIIKELFLISMRGKQQRAQKLEWMGMRTRNHLENESYFTIHSTPNHIKNETKSFLLFCFLFEPLCRCVLSRFIIKKMPQTTGVMYKSSFKVERSNMMNRTKIMQHQTG